MRFCGTAREFAPLLLEEVLDIDELRTLLDLDDADVDKLLEDDALLTPTEDALLRLELIDEEGDESTDELIPLPNELPVADEAAIPDTEELPTAGDCALPEDPPPHATSNWVQAKSTRYLLQRIYSPRVMPVFIDKLTMQTDIPSGEKKQI